MQELIKIQISKGGKQVVSARELHQFLGIKTAFGIWIERMTKYGFVENTDYAVIKSERPDNQVVMIQDFVITTDMAKELSMIQRTDKGKQARLYFIECERLVKHPTQEVATQALPTDFISALEQLLISKKSELALEEKVKELEPKGEFYDTVIEAKGTYDFREATAVLKLPYGRTKLFERLRTANILQSDNLPYRQFIDRNYFQVVERTWTDKDGSEHLTTQTRFTQKGIDWMIKNKQTVL